MRYMLIHLARRISVSYVEHTSIIAACIDFLQCTVASAPLTAFDGLLCQLTYAATQMKISPGSLQKQSADGKLPMTTTA